MTDPIAAPATEDPTPAPTAPVMSQAEIDALVERKAQEKAQALSDQRVAGLMSTYDKKIAAMEAQQRKLAKSFGNVDDDEPDPRVAELEAELQRVQREAAEAEAARLYPDEFPAFKELTGRETPAEQLAFLREWRQKLTAPPQADPIPAVPEPVPPTPPVDSNQPARSFASDRGGREQMSEQDAWEILNQFDRMPGH